MFWNTPQYKVFALHVCDWRQTTVTNFMVYLKFMAL